MARVALLPSCAIASSNISPDLGSKILIFLSLHVVTNRDPSQFQHAEYTTSGWQSMRASRPAAMQRSCPVKGAIDFRLISNAQPPSQLPPLLLPYRILAARETENYGKSNCFLIRTAIAIFML